jgi:polysaccharide export outer membrane protein
MPRIGVIAVLLMLLSSVTNAQAADASSTPAVGQTAEYLIGPGDSLRVVVLQNPELGSEVIVRPDGNISLPLVNDMMAVGKTPSKLAADIEGVLQEYVRKPSVGVIVTQARGTFSQIKVVGQAVSPRAIPYRNGMRVLDVVIEVGGLSQFAAGNRAKVMRTENGKTKQIRVRLHDLLNKGDVSQDLPLQPGDILVIPEARF